MVRLIKVVPGKLRRGRKITVPPYSVLAEFYDHIMEHVDYDSWAEYVIRVALLHGLHGKKALDIACGTGSLGRRLHEKGYEVYGCDGSMAMLRQAKAKLGKLASNNRFVCGDMRALPVRSRADIIFSLYDSMNYLMRPYDWRRCLDQVAARLAPRGLFVFDVSTVVNSQLAFSDYRHEEVSILGHFERRSRYDEHQMIQYNHFEIQLRRDRKVIYVEEHRQRIRHLAEIEKMIEGGPLRYIASYSGFSLQPGSEGAERVHFILQKP